ncbi:MAG: hypothetical protein JJU29_03320 [Verrucomicrobia bacterium]|nr:hypothetical protein [Verrucomicrobiota bacterium]MCH8510732.1 hypothetical protein [Kiritimatiellia bacterium]
MMSKPFISSHRLVQFLVLSISVVVLALIFLPRLMGPRAFVNDAQYRMLSNGRGIHQSILAYDLEHVLVKPSVDPWPSKDSEHYETNSTDYFRWLMSPDVGALDQDFGVFVGPGVRMSTSWENFQSSHNAWSVVSDVSIDSASQTPFLVTRNLNETHLVDWQGRGQKRLENLGSLKSGGYETPYDRKYVIVIHIGGSGHVLSKRNLNWENLNPVSIDNVIMEP